MKSEAFFPELNDTDSLSGDYAINLLWSNVRLDKAQRFIKGNDEAAVMELIEPAINWAKANPKAHVVIWYDSSFVTAEAVRETQQLLDNLKKQGPTTNVVLKDIHEIPIVKNNPDIFSEQVPIYFRVDLLKCIIVAYDAEHQKKSASVFTDLDVKPLSCSDLFKPEILALLEKAGLLMINKGGRIENKFIQLDCENEPMLSALKVIINLGMLRVVTSLNSEVPASVNLTSESVFVSMIYELPGLYGHFRDKKELQIFNEYTGEYVGAYDFKTYGYEPFGLFISSQQRGYPQTVKLEGALARRRDLESTHPGSSHVQPEFKGGIPPSNGEQYQCQLMEVNWDLPENDLSPKPK